MIVTVTLNAAIDRTLTVPNFLRARRLTIQVPGLRKSAAVRSMLGGPISTACPASILRTHANAALFLDLESASALEAGPRADQR